MNALFLAFFFHLWTPIEESKEEWFQRHNWQCETDMGCVEECLKIAKQEGVDPEICDESEE